MGCRDGDNTVVSQVPKGLAVITASTGEEKAIEQHQHGVFTSAFVESARKLYDSMEPVTVTNIYKEIQDKFKRQSTPQTPTIQVGGVSAGDMELVPRKTRPTCEVDVEESANECDSFTPYRFVLRWSVVVRSKVPSLKEVLAARIEELLSIFNTKSIVELKDSNKRKLSSIDEMVIHPRWSIRIENSVAAEDVHWDFDNWRHDIAEFCGDNDLSSPKLVQRGFADLS
eukprot:NODE_46_length_1657_cov_286.338983_g43_i0.p1 GENE.NODE_46_length_1657_cov_286.338983_g43_i0~~NODE_46_length_1657_cov_286.338983_g43_i0.p1  ORF type:complete len:227 (-),score=21.13 NODE_46_length_1657_cov_286.338983_g43_i0:232-912(-)